MRIRCPQCQFERTLDPTQIPASATMATCPQCRHRFRFHEAQVTTLEDMPGVAGTCAAAHTHTVPIAPNLKSSAAASAPPSSPRLRQSSVMRRVPPLIAGDDEPDMAPHADRPSTPAAPHEPLNAAAAEDSPPPPLPRLPTEQDGDDPLPPGAVIPVRRNAQEASPDSPVADTAADAEKDSKDASTQHNSRPDAAGRGAERTSAGIADIPWESPERYGLLNGFYQTILRVLFAAPSFFVAVGASRTGLVRPCIFYVLLGTMQSVVERLWLMSRLEELANMDDAQVQAGISAISQSMNLPMLLISMPPLLFVQLMFYAALFTLMIRLVQPDRANFTITLRIIAYSAAPAVLCVVPMVGSFAAAIWFAACCFLGCKHALGLSWNRTVMAIGPLYVLAVAISLHVVKLLMSAA